MSVKVVFFYRFLDVAVMTDPAVVTVVFDLYNSHLISSTVSIVYLLISMWVYGLICLGCRVAHRNVCNELN